MKKLLLLVLILGLCKYGISQENGTPPFKITKVEFANGDLDGTIMHRSTQLLLQQKKN